MSKVRILARLALQICLSLKSCQISNMSGFMRRMFGNASSTNRNSSSGSLAKIQETSEKPADSRISRSSVMKDVSFRYSADILL